MDGVQRKQGSIDCSLWLWLLLTTIMVSAGCSSDSTSENKTQSFENGATTNGSAITEGGTETNTNNESGTDIDSETEDGTGSVEGIDTNPISIGIANCSTLTASGDATSIAGLYDATDFNEASQDVVYLEITNSGSLIAYDYQQDDVDRGDDCYVVVPGTSALTSVGNDQFDVTTYDNSDENCETSTGQATITRNDTELNWTFIDADDEDGDGDTSELITDTLPVVTKRPVESFNRCDM